MSTEERPWGNFEVLCEGPGYKVKRLTIYPSQRFSLQYHMKRSEHWFIVEGTGIVTTQMAGANTEYNRPVGPRQTVFIVPGERHRARCVGRSNLVFIEVQLGDYLEEDDIVRLEDDFGRIKE